MTTNQHLDHDLTTAETTTMSVDQTLDTNTAASAAPTNPSTRRRRLGLAALATLAMGAALTPVAISGSGATALPICPDGHFQAILLVHLGNQPNHSLGQAFSV